MEILSLTFNFYPRHVQLWLVTADTQRPQRKCRGNSEPKSESLEAHKKMCTYKFMSLPHPGKCIPSEDFRMNVPLQLDDSSLFRSSNRNLTRMIRLLGRIIILRKCMLCLFRFNLND